MAVLQPGVCEFPRVSNELRILRLIRKYSEQYGTEQMGVIIFVGLGIPAKSQSALFEQIRQILPIVGLEVFRNEVIVQTADDRQGLCDYRTARVLSKFWRQRHGLA